MKTLGNRIRQKRTELGMTQEELGLLLVPPVKRQAICKWENAEVKQLNRSRINELASILHCDVKWLMGFDEGEDVTVTYEAPGKEPVKALVDKVPIIGQASLRAKLYQVAAKVTPENLEAAIEVLSTLT